MYVYILSTAFCAAVVPLTLGLVALFKADRSDIPEVTRHIFGRTRTE